MEKIASKGIDISGADILIIQAQTQIEDAKIQIQDLKDALDAVDLQSIDSTDTLLSTIQNMEGLKSRQSKHCILRPYLIIVFRTEKQIPKLF